MILIQESDSRQARRKEEILSHFLLSQLGHLEGKRAVVAIFLLRNFLWRND